MIFQLTLSLGSTCIYQGEELGLDDADRLTRDQLQDPWGIERFSDTFKGRDTCRTPMTWQQSQPNGGFSGDTSVESWLPVDKRHLSKGGLDQQGMQGSLFTRNKAHLAWRKSQPALTQNAQLTLVEGPDDVIAFRRKGRKTGDAMLCAFNFSNDVKEVDGMSVQPWSAAFS